jgi:hypothetical protein
MVYSQGRERDISRIGGITPEILEAMFANISQAIPLRYSTKDGSIPILEEAITKNNPELPANRTIGCISPEELEGLVPKKPNVVKLPPLS